MNEIEMKVLVNCTLKTLSVSIQIVF